MTTSPCYILEKCWMGALCRYFREVVLAQCPRAGGVPCCGRPHSGNPALPGMRQGFSPRWLDTVLFFRLRQGRNAQKAERIYAEISGECG